MDPLNKITKTRRRILLFRKPPPPYSPASNGGDYDDNVIIKLLSQPRNTIMASSPIRAPAAAVAGQQQSRLLDMQKKFQQKHLATVAAIKGNTGSTTSSVVDDQPIPPVRRFGGLQQQQQQPQRRISGGGPVTSSNSRGGSDSVVQVDVKGKVRQLFAERHQQLGPGLLHHQQQKRQRRRSLTGRDRSRPLRKLSGTDDDPLCKTVCFTAPSLASGTDMIGINGAKSDVRGELLALFGRLPNLGGQLWSESFRSNNKMKTAQSAPELKWLLDGSGGGRGPGPGPMVGPGEGGGGPGPPAAGVKADVKSKAKSNVKAAKEAEATGDGGENGDDDDQLEQQQQRPTGRINSKTATIIKKPLATVNGNGPTGYGRVTKKPSLADSGANYAGAVEKPSGTTVNNNRLLLPPVVQPTVINALAAGADAASAVASVGAAAAAGARKPMVKAGKLPPATPGLQKPAAPARKRIPAPAASKPTASRRQPTAANRNPAAGTRLQSVKPQLSADRGPPAAGMSRCPMCSRDFASDRLPKHEEVCRRTRERDRKRKVFDTSKKRLEAVAAEAGVDVASFKKKSEKEDMRATEKLQKKKNAWRKKHDQLVRNVRAARAVQQHLAAGGTVRDLPPELENATADQDDEVDSDLVKCPHCNRTFNEAAAERHMPLCADRQRNAAARMNNKKR